MTKDYTQHPMRKVTFDLPEGPKEVELSDVLLEWLDVTNENIIFMAWNDAKRFVDMEVALLKLIITGAMDKGHTAPQDKVNEVVHGIVLQKEINKLAALEDQSI